MIEVSAKYNATPPTVVDKKKTELQTDVNGNLKVALAAGSASAGTVTTKGAAADGAAVSGAGNPNLIAGQDGTNVQTVKTDTTGRVEVVTIPLGDATSGSGTITSGGVSQDVFAADTSRRGWAFQNQSTDYLYLRQNTSTAATADQNCLRIAPGQEYVADYVNGEKLKVIGPTTGQAFWARSW